MLEGIEFVFLFFLCFCIFCNGCVVCESLGNCFVFVCLFIWLFWMFCVEMFWLGDFLLCNFFEVFMNFEWDIWIIVVVEFMGCGFIFFWGFKIVLYRGYVECEYNYMLMYLRWKLWLYLGKLWFRLFFLKFFR